MNRKAPWILLIALFIILVFIAGVRWGARVEKTNKKVSVLLSIPPTRPAPTEAPIGVVAYKHAGCGIEVLNPMVLIKKQESSQSAQFNRNTINVFEFDCAGRKLTPQDEKLKTAAVTFKNRQINTQVRQKVAKKYLYFEIINPLNLKKITIMIDEKIYPLFESSLKFSLK